MARRSERSRRLARAKTAEAYARRVDTEEAWLTAADAWEEAGARGEAQQARLGRPSAKTGGWDRYEEGERSRFIRLLDESEQGSRHEKMAASKEFRRDLVENPDWVAEQIGWMLNGTYGQGEMVWSRELLARMATSSKHRSPVPILIVVFGQINKVPRRAAYRAWLSLAPERRADLTRMIEEEIRSGVVQRRREERRQADNPERDARRQNRRR